MQRLGTEAIRTQIQPSKPKREKQLTNSQNTKDMNSFSLGLVHSNNDYIIHVLYVYRSGFCHPLSFHTSL